MIDDDIRAIKRRVLWNKVSLVLSFVIYTSLVIVPLVLLSKYRAGTTGRIALVVSSLILIMVIIFVYHRGVRHIDTLTGAAPVGPDQLNGLKSLSDDISIATGKPLPELMLIADPQCCNLFSIRRKGRVFIYTGSGVFEVMDPDELRSAIAHEMAHIHNGDAGINTMTITLRAVSENIRYRMPVANFFLDLLEAAIVLVLFFSISLAVAFEGNTFFVILVAFLIPVAYMFVFGMLFTVFLPFIVFNRDLVADKLAAKWTLQPQSLIDAMLKTQENDESKSISFIRDISFVPTVRENPHKYMQSGAVEERIRNLKESFKLPW